MLRDLRVTEYSHHEQQLRDIIKGILSVKSGKECTCDDCYDRLDEYVDRLRAGEDPATVLPEITEHLARCGECNDEFQALVAMLNASPNSPGPRPSAQ